MTYIQPFTKLNKDNAETAGGKGASLGEMTQAGISVPPGYVILASAFERFAEETDLTQEITSILKTVNTEATHTVEDASEQIQALIFAKKIPEDIKKEILSAFQSLDSEFVAVRSSATSEDSADAAWAGQLDSFLNTTEETLLENVRKCWASLFTPRAVFYRFEKELHDTFISVAVVVQKMVNSEKSGIAFSVHPVTEDRNQLIIEAGLGLGEAIVSGSVTPDSYVVTKEPREIIDINVATQNKALYRKDGGGNEWKELGSEGEQQVLTKEQIEELSEMILVIENHYGFPCDIEWAMEGGDFYIVQSRPITTLGEVEISSNSSFQKIEKVFSRDFSLIALQMDYLPESALERPWATEKNPHQPYLIFWRNDGTSKIHFNIKGIDWIKNELEQRVREDDAFLDTVENNVKDGIKFIRPIYEKKKVLDREELIRFIDEFIAVYHWIEAMWWIKGMADEELSDIDCSNIVSLREETEELSASTDIVIRKSLADLYPQYGHLAAMISIEELKGEDVIDEEMLKKRDEGFILIENKILLDKTFDEVLREYDLRIEEKNIDLGTKFLDGEKVSKGKYVGKIVRVMGHNDFEKVKKGDVIVSPMTMVDFLPIMKKAGAFITDEGGALCHAAIVSRELGKPCVVGTEIATEVLKDGDEVEVNADDGTIRILEKHKNIYKQNVTRDICLITFEVWVESDTNYLQDWLGITTERVILERKNGVITAYESEQIFKDAQASIQERIKDLDWIDTQIEKYREGIEKASILGKELLASPSKEKLELFFKTLAKTQGGLALVYFVPTLDGIDESVKERCLEERKKTEDFFYNINDTFEAVIQTMYPEYVEYMKVINIEEFLGEIPPVSELKKRLDHFIYYEKTFFYDKTLGDVERELGISIEQPTIGDSQDVITGEVAYEGKVKGRVIVVYGKKDIEKVRAGDILVAPMTIPELLPAMRKAAGFITDEGGVTCHAAIVAREMKKPCIIGTKIATHVLKDGDEVEVNADTGEVKVIKSNTVIFSELIHIEAPLIAVEILSEQESLRDIPWSEEVFEYFPYCIFERKEGNIFYFINKEGVSWKTEQAGKFDRQVLIKEVLKRYKTLKNTLVSEETLSKEELKEFISQVEDIWTWLDCLWWMVEYYDQNNKEGLKELLKVRKETEYFVPGLFAVIRNSVTALLPDNMKMYVDILKLEEVLNKEYPSEEVLQKRLNSFMYFNGKFTSKDTLKKKYDLKFIESSEIDKNTKVLKGTTAYPGVVRGKVRKISNRDQLPSFKEGEVIVSSTTTPDFLPAMKKASAIISEHGGAICHAAITSRELKIPCVVGVQGATYILEDGMEIEVNANEGIVKILDNSSLLGEYKSYQRLFKVSGMPYLVSDSFSCHYRTMKCLLTFYEGFWTSYLPKTEVEKTLRKGYELYRNKESFEEYRDSFLKYREDSQASFESITSKDEISREELEKFLKLISDLFIYYSKTEFFYTDEAAARMEDDPFLKENLKELDSIKNGGREYLNKIFFGASGYLSKVLLILSGQFGVPQTDLPHYSQKELLNLYEGQTVDNELIDKRKKSYLFVTNDSREVEIKIGDDAASVISDFEEQSEENQTSLKGITANGGYIKAKVRIVTSGYDNFDELHKIIKEMNPGEVLVAETTSPELMMACKKASAILTNQGGLMSHAAIISRELGIPCIVGLGNITEIVSTGEEVEIDGDNAIVTLISRKDPNQKV